MRIHQTLVSGVAASALSANLPTFDLSVVMKRVAKEHPDWSYERLEDAERVYREFCSQMKAANGGHLHVTNDDMDEVWHWHVLHTRRYMADCVAYYGGYVHHTPAGDAEMRANGGACSGSGGDYKSFGPGYIEMRPDAEIIAPYSDLPIGKRVNVA